MPAPTYYSYTNLTAPGNGNGFELDNSSSLWTFDNDISATVSYGDGIHGTLQCNGNTLVVNSYITSNSQNGIRLEGVQTTVKIGQKGQVGGAKYGIWMSGDHSELINDGWIGGGTRSVEIKGGSYAGLINNNIILKDIYLTAKIINAEFGKNSHLSSTLYTDADVATIKNNGTIGAGPNGASFLGYIGNETLINTGNIKGRVFLRDGNDTFDNRGGTADADVYGDGGDDTFIIDSVDVKINENAGEGIDTVKSTVSLSLVQRYPYEELENLTLIGNGAINGTGNKYNNAITGNGTANVLQGLEGNDTLDGGAGVDKLEGGLGNDTYYVDNAGDVVIEAANAGTDTVIASASHALAADAHVEVLKAASGALNLALTGSGIANTIIGEAGNDTLDGGGGADKLEGGLGNDTYCVDNAGDVVVDTGGIDAVKSAASFSIAGLTAIENITLTGSGAINGTGNGFDNAITGNAAANVLQGLEGSDTLDGDGGYDILDGGAGFDRLQGGAGNDKLYGGADADTLFGGAGKDVLTGGKGKDTFVFDTKPNRKTNLDKIVDFNVKDDTIWLDNKYMPKLGKGTALKPGKLNKAFFTLSDKAKDKNDYLVYDNKKGILYYDADGAGSKAAVEIAILKKGLKMTYKDFFII